jgi:uncharacterized coiled-coil DUF342 family protein
MYGGYFPIDLERIQAMMGSPNPWRDWPVTNIIYYIQNFTNEYLEISFWVLVATTSLLVTFWVVNRKRIQKLSHQIPASVVKNYLDSIIQNSTALKSSLFRGGGLEIGGGVPAVMPVDRLPSSASLQLSTGFSEEVSQKTAEISALKAKLSDKENLLKELEKNLEELQASQGSGNDGSDSIIKSLNSKIKELEDKIAKLQSSTSQNSNGDGELAQKLEEVSAERDQLKEKLMEYEIIEEDLANLKRLQKENEQLKLTIKQIQGGSSPAVTSEPVETVDEMMAANSVETDLMESDVDEAPEMAQEELESPAEEEVEEVAAASNNPFEDEMENVAELPKKKDAPTKTSAISDQKSAEELLSEFEKMLG